MSYAIALEQLLKDRSSTLHGRLMEIKERSQNLLTYANAAFPYFTPHDFKHSKEVEVNLNWIIPEDIKQKLGEYEIFFLIIAAWLHDWGMVCGQDMKSEQLAEVRRVHHIRTYENFTNLHDKLGLNKHEGDIAGRIARGHRVEDLNDNFYDEQIYSTNIHIRVRFLAALVRIADECDIWFNRVPELLYYSLNPSGASKDFFETHLNIRGVGLDRPGGHKIEITAVASDPEMARVLRALRDKIQRVLDDVKAILALNGIELDYVDIRIFARGFIDKPIAFRLDEARVTELLVGEALYAEKTVAIRELLQNSVDACRSRFTEPEHGWIRLFKDMNDLVIEDNGEGMDFETAYDFLARKGFSYYRSKDFSKAHPNAQFDPISKWGLGILSCFMIASSATIETLKEGKEPCRFIIPSVGAGWRYERGSRSEPGTSIRLALKPSFTSIDVEKLVRHYLKESKVRVFVGQKTSTPLKFEWDFDDLDILPIEKKNDNTIRVESEKRFSDESLKVRCYLVPAVSNKVYLANQGFFVGELRPEPREMPIPPSSVVLITTEKEIVDLDISREKVITGNAKFASFLEKWVSIVTSFLREEIKKKETPDPEDDFSRSYRWQVASIRYGLGLSRLIDQLGRSESLKDSPSRLENFVAKEIPFLVLSTDGFCSMNLEELDRNFQNSIRFYRTIGHSAAEFRKECEFAGSKLKGKLGPKEAAVFSIRGDYRSSLSLKLLGKLLDHVKKVSPLDLLTIIQGEQFDSVSTTGIDSLLCPFSALAIFPKELRSAVVCKKPFRISVADHPGEPRGFWKATMTLMFGPIDVLRAATSMELHSPQYFLADLLAGRGTEANENVKLIEPGLVLFDAEDAFIEILLKKSNLVLGSSTLTKMAKDYFASLAGLFLSPNPAGYNFLRNKEEEICALLEYQCPGEMKSRMAPLSTLLLNVNTIVVVPRMPSAFVQLETKDGDFTAEGDLDSIYEDLEV